MIVVICLMVFINIIYDDVTSILISIINSWKNYLEAFDADYILL